MEYICLNGEILPRKHAKISFDNRAFRFGEGLIEEMRSSGIRVPLFKAHFQRLTKGLDVLGIKHLASFNEESLLRSIELLIHRRRFFMANKVTLTLWRDDDVDLVSMNDTVRYMVEVEPLNENKFTLNDRGYNLDLYANYYKGKSELSPFVTINSTFKMMALRYAQERLITACLILDFNGRIVEEATSNVFFCASGTIYTPALSTGCTDGVMRRAVIELANRNDYLIAETESLPVQFLYDVEEIFLAHDVEGIRWISGYKDKRYRRKKCIEFINILNKVFR